MAVGKVLYLLGKTVVRVGKGLYLLGKAPGRAGTPLKPLGKALAPLIAAFHRLDPQSHHDHNLTK